VISPPGCVPHPMERGKPADVCGACHLAGTTSADGTVIVQHSVSMDADMKIKQLKSAGSVQALSGPHFRVDRCGALLHMFETL
jgi:hypothetical protein